MSASVIKEFLVELGFSVDSNSANKFNDTVNKSGIQAAKLGAAVIAASAAITAFVTRVADELDVMVELGERTNTTATEIDRLRYIAEQTDSSAGALDSSLEGIAKNAGDAAMGVGRAGKIFEKIGVQVKDANGKLKTSTQLMGEIGASIKDMEKGQQSAILERLGIDRTLLKSITADVSGLASEYDAMIKASGMSLDEAAQAGADYMDSLNKLKFTMNTLGRAVAAKFMRGIANSFETLRKALIENMPKIIGAITPIIDVIMRLSDTLIFLAGQALSVIGYIVGGFLKLNDATDGWAGYILAAVVAWKTLNLAFLASPVGVILSLAAAIALLMDDFAVWQEGGESLIPWEKWKAEIDAAMAYIQMFRDFMQPIFDALFSGFDKLQNLGSFIGQNIPVLTPSPAQGAAMTGGSGATVNQQTQVIVQGASDPAATGRAVAGEQKNVNADIARNMQGRVR